MINLYEIIQKKVMEDPNSIAVTHNNHSVTFHELALYTNAAERKIRANNIEPGDTAIVYMKNSIALIATVLACLKMGLVVLPIDEIQTPRKVEEVYLKSGASIVLCDKLLSYKLNPQELRFIVFENSDFNSAPLQDYESTIVNNEHAYCIFTSGSSKEPKGVLLTHQGILNHIYAKISVLSLDQHMKTCLSMNVGFVASIWLVLTPLILGGQLYIYDKEILENPLRLYERILADRITVVSLLPQYIKLLTSLLSQHDKIVSSGELRAVISTGDILTPDIVRDFYTLFQIPLINAYGQSECSDDTFHYQIPYDFNGHTVPIGRPIEGCQPYIFDENMDAVGNGQKGELYIGGVCLSDGYIDDQNNYRFTIHPCNGMRLFKTGDIVTQDAEGVYYYFGRKDNQIKVNGYRIMPEEIEEKIKQFPNVRECIVGLVKRSNNTLLAAVVFTFKNEPLNHDDLRTFLSERLPLPMIPSKFIQMEDLPITANGKTDRIEILKHVTMLYDYDDELQHYIEEMPEKKRAIVELILDKLIGLIHRKSQLFENIESIGVTSLKFIELVVDLEEKYNVTFHDDKMSLNSFSNLSELIDYVIILEESVSIESVSSTATAN